MQDAEAQGIRTSGGKWGVAIPLLVFMTISGMFLYALYSLEPSRLPSVLIGKPVPEFNLPSIKGLSGASAGGFSSVNLKNGEVSLVNVWASWCVPCRQEHPYLTELAKRSGAPLFGINYKDKAENALKFLTELGDPFKAHGADLNGRAAIDWGVYGVPETFIVDGKGRIAYKHVGPLTPDIVEKKILPIINKIRDGK